MFYTLDSSSISNFASPGDLQKSVPENASMIGTKNGDGGRDGLIIVLSKVDPQADPNGTDHIFGPAHVKGRAGARPFGPNFTKFYPYFSFF